MMYGVTARSAHGKRHEISSGGVTAAMERR